MKFVRVNNAWKYHKISNLNIFVKTDFNHAFDDFWSAVMNNQTKVIGLLLKVKGTNGSILTLGPLIKFTKTDRSLLRKVLMEYINIKGNNYSDIEISSVIFQFIELDSNATTNIKGIEHKKPKSYQFGNNNLPLTTDLSKWGKVTKVGKDILIKSDNYESDIWVSIQNNKQVYKFKIEDKIILTVIDYLGKDSSNFIRSVNKHSFIISNGEIIFKSIERKTKFITKILKDKNLSNNFLTFDIETRKINGVHKPYCISFYDGKDAWSFFLSDFNSIDDMMNTAINSIMRAKYNKWNIYAHHGSKFDYIFILKFITLLGEVDLLMKDGKFINIKYTWISDGTGYYINFRDSLLMLPSSLRKLSKAFGVEAKGFFPFEFVNNPSIPLDYIGKTPDYNYYEGIGKDEYKTMESKSWNLRKESIHYCELDCKVLHQILSKFNVLIFNKFTLNVHKFPTLSSLALGIFRSGYLGLHKIPKLGGHIFDFIKQGYTGGRVDVIKPYGEDLYYYDVNSLYPTVYSRQPMPVGTPKWFEGNILKFDPEAFGFFRCKIQAPDNLYLPILQTHVKTENGVRTVAPLGTWTDVLLYNLNIF
jgi:hypothetical protein